MRLNPLLGRLPTYPTLVLDQRRASLIAAGLPVFDFGVGDPTEPTPAFIRKEMQGNVADNCRYPSVRGERRVREAFAAYAYRRFGVTLDPDTQLLPSSGSKEAIFHLPLLVLDPAAADRTVVFPDPGYSVYQRGALFAGGIAYPQVLSGDFVQRVWELPEQLLQHTRLLWINSPHNPTGAVMSHEDLHRTVETCRRYNILLASDECYADVWFERPPASVLEVAGPGAEGVLAIFSLSKRSGMTGYRTGMIAGDTRVMALLHSLRVNPGLAPQDFVNAAAAVAWADDQHAEERRGIFSQKRKVMIDFFREVGLRVVASEASFYLWVEAPGGDGQAYAERLLDVGIMVNPGSMFAVTPSARPYIRLALVPDVPTCHAAVSAWRTVL